MSDALILEGSECPAFLWVLGEVYNCFANALSFL